MGKTKPVVILACFLLLFVARGYCLEQQLSAAALKQISEKVEKLEIYFEAGMYQEAEDILENLITQFPDEPRFTYLKAIVDYEQQDYAQAEQVFSEFIEQYPDVAEPYYILGEINLRQGKPDEAKRYWARYSELAPEDYDLRNKLSAITGDNSYGTSIVADGREDPAIVKKLGFYGGCVSAQKEQSIQLINGSSCNWSSMGIDFVYPIDLRGKRIVLKLKGKQGGERLELTFRDKFAKGYEPQLVLLPDQETLSSDWRNIKVSFAQEEKKMDLSSVVHLGLEFGSATVQNPANSVLFVEDIIIEDDHN